MTLQCALAAQKAKHILCELNQSSRSTLPTAEKPRFPGIYGFRCKLTKEGSQGSKKRRSNATEPGPCRSCQCQWSHQCRGTQWHRDPAIQQHFQTWISLGLFPSQQPCNTQHLHPDVLLLAPCLVLQDLRNSSISLVLLQV